MMRLLLLLTILLLTNCSAKDYIISFSTPYGKMDAILYDKTPEHKALFIQEIKKGTFENTSCTKLNPQFILTIGKTPQPLSSFTKIAPTCKDEILPEYDSTLFHRKGSLGAFTLSSGKSTIGCEFYITEGRKFSKEELDLIEAKTHKKISTLYRNEYQTTGGIPYLDQENTLFGEIIKGISIIDQLQHEPSNEFGKPNRNLPIKISIKKITKKRITKEYSYIY